MKILNPLLTTALQILNENARLHSLLTLKNFRWGVTVYAKTGDRIDGTTVYNFWTKVPIRSPGADDQLRKYGGLVVLKLTPRKFGDQRKMALYVRCHYVSATAVSPQKHINMTNLSI